MYVVFVSCHVELCEHQAHSYIYAKFAAAYTLSKKGIFQDVTNCNMTLVYLQQVYSN